MNYHQKVIVLLSFVVFAGLFGCERSDWSTDPPPPESIAATNEVRIEHGVRTIKKNWTFYARQFGEEKWHNAKGQLCKQVYYDRLYHDIHAESDYYYSGRTFRSLDPDGGTVQEMAQISYVYVAKRFAIAVITDNKEIRSMVDGLGEMLKYPTIYGSYVGYGYMGRTNEETLNVADKILKMWGLERL